MKLIVPILLAPAFAALAAEPPAPKTPAEVAARYKLVWQDEFEGAQLDLKKWQHVRPGTPHHDGVLDQECATLDNRGNLVITIKQVADKFHTGLISTQGKFAPKFGYFECRARVQHHQGITSGFTLRSQQIAAPERGEPNDPARNGVDLSVMKYRTTRSDGFDLDVTWGGYKAFKKSEVFRVKNPEVAAGWHTYGVEWTPKGYTFYLDGMKTWECRVGVSHASQYLALSADITHWAGDIRKAQLPDDIAFDYVRVWQATESLAGR